jgi:hypothetical protein
MGSQNNPIRFTFGREEINRIDKGIERFTKALDTLTH